MLASFRTRWGVTGKSWDHASSPLPEGEREEIEPNPRFGGHTPRWTSLLLALTLMTTEARADSPPIAAKWVGTGWQGLRRRADPGPAPSPTFRMSTSPSGGFRQGRSITEVVLKGAGHGQWTDSGRKTVTAIHVVRTVLGRHPLDALFRALSKRKRPRCSRSTSSTATASESVAYFKSGRADPSLRAPGIRRRGRSGRARTARIGPAPAPAVGPDGFEDVHLSSSSRLTAKGSDQARSRSLGPGQERPGSRAANHRGQRLGRVRPQGRRPDPRGSCISARPAAIAGQTLEARPSPMATAGPTPPPSPPASSTRRRPSLRPPDRPPLDDSNTTGHRSLDRPGRRNRWRTARAGLVRVAIDGLAARKPGRRRGPERRRLAEPGSTAPTDRSPGSTPARGPIGSKSSGPRVRTGIELAFPPGPRRDRRRR